MDLLKTLSDCERWQIALAKDRRYDGAFIVGVHSTGIYCRPSCPARAPLRANVRFYSGSTEAEEAGLRPCKRCSPGSVSAEEACVMAAVAAIRERGAMSLAELAALTGYAPTHFQRLFKRSIGVSPAAYARGLREERIRARLNAHQNDRNAHHGDTMSPSKRLHAQMKGRLGMSPGEIMKGGAGQTLRWAVLTTSLGELLVAASAKGVCCVAFGVGEAELARRFPKAVLEPAGDEQRALFAAVLDAVERPGTGSGSAAIPIDVKGTAFQMRVWDALRQIPVGETRSYGELAAALGSPGAARAVGGANGANQVAVLIPCHRVIAADGTLGGYAWGVEVKAELLRREGGGPG